MRWKTGAQKLRILPEVTQDLRPELWPVFLWVLIRQKANLPLMQHLTPRGFQHSAFHQL